MTYCFKFISSKIQYREICSYRLTREGQVRYFSQKVVP